MDASLSSRSLAKIFTIVTALTSLVTSTAATFATGPDVSFDFSRLVEYRDVTPAERAKRYPNERLVTAKLPISVRFQGLAQGEVELLDIAIDGTASHVRFESFSPTTKLGSEATSIQSTTSTKIGKSIGATLGAALPIPVGPIAAEIAPSITAGKSKSDEQTEKVFRLPPKLPFVVSGTFAEGQGVFFKFKQSTQTTFEGVHELELTLVVPADWDGSGLRITCTARGHKSVLWMDKPATFGHVADAIEFYPEGNMKQRAAAARRNSAGNDAASRVQQASFFSSAAEGIKDAAKSAVGQASL